MRMCRLRITIPICPSDMNAALMSMIAELVTENKVLCDMFCKDPTKIEAYRKAKALLEDSE